MNGFDIDKYREANTVKIFVTSPTSSKSNAKAVFKAYLRSGVNLSFNADSDGIFGSINLLRSKILNVGLQHFMGMSSVLDIERKMFFTGASPLNFNIDCFLVLKDSYENDIKKPIKDLLKLTLPEREGLTSISKILGNKAGEEPSSNVIDESTWSLFQSALDFVQKFTGNMYLLKPPKPYTNNNYTVKFGPYLIRGIIIKSVNISFPNFIYDGPNGAYPDHVDLSFNVETLRTASLGAPQVFEML